MKVFFRRQLRRSGRGALGLTAVLVFLVLAIIIAQTQFHESFPAVAFLITASATGAALIAVTVWSAFFSGSRSGKRFIPLALLLTGGAAAAASFRVSEVNGDMIPRLTFRWAPDADENLAGQVVLAPAEANAGDLGPLQTPTLTDFPQFLGPERRGVVQGVTLATDWEAEPPQLLWRDEIGAGWSAFAVVGDHAVTVEQRGPNEIVICRHVETGEVVWAHGDERRLESTLGGDGPRATPTIHAGKVYTLGGMGILNCLDGATGRVVWSHDLMAEYDAPKLEWGISASPLIVDDMVVVAAGADEGRSLLAFDAASGDFRWGGGDELSSYASPTLGELAGVRQIVVIHETHVAGHDVAGGEILWQADWPGSSSGAASASQPVVLDGDRVFLSKGYLTGCKMLRVTTDDEGTWQIEELWKSNLLKTKLTNVVVKDGYAYGLDEGILCCLSLADGKKMWKVRQGRYGHGQILLVGDEILVQAESGEVALVAATPDGFQEHAKFQAIEGKSWANPSLSGRRLLLRNSREAACYLLPGEVAYEPPVPPPEGQPEAPAA